MAAFSTLTNLLRHHAGKLTGRSAGLANTPNSASSSASPFRIGMVLTLDPTPFILGGAALRIKQPDLDTTDSVVAVGQLSGLNAGASKSIYRLYFGDRSNWLNVVASDSGDVEECRFFQTLDEVHPANAAEWEFWLGAADGYIGYPQFQTRDGTMWTRHWNQGQTRIAPLEVREVVRSLEGHVQTSLTRKHTTMLYSRATELTDPCPTGEFLMVSAIETGASGRPGASSHACIQMSVGIDINEASLSLS